MVSGIPCPDNDTMATEESVPEGKSQNPTGEYRMRIYWSNVIGFSLMHVAALYGAYLSLTSAKLLTTIYAFLLYQSSFIGITAGTHRLWSHRSYKATWPLQLILMLMNTIAFQGHVIEWATDHRLHHKYSETDADPHNAKRGFFFAHVGWLACDRHPEVLLKSKEINNDDLEQNPILAFQKKYYYYYLVPLFCFILPPFVPVYLWNETWPNAIFISVALRHIVSSHSIALVNSAAHIYGYKPYDKSINPSENATVAIFSMGEGWHNYHHTFPMDYRAAELGLYKYNPSTVFIDFFAWIGWAYDLRMVSKDMVRRRAMKTGDGTHEICQKIDKNQFVNDCDAGTATSGDY